MPAQCCPLASAIHVISNIPNLENKGRACLIILIREIAPLIDEMGTGLDEGGVTYRSGVFFFHRKSGSQNGAQSFKSLVDLRSADRKSVKFDGNGAGGVSM